MTTPSPLARSEPAGADTRDAGRITGPLAVLAIVLLLLPLAALVVRGEAKGFTALGSADVLDATARSLWAATVATVLSFVLGLPLAWQIARGQRRAWRWLRGVVALPIVMPPVVMGIALLAAFGRRGVLGGPLAAFGVDVAFTPLAPVIAATFVALPFFVLTVEGAIHGLDRDLEGSAAVLGATPRRVFLTITLPALRPALVAGAALAWARALGEFGATMIFAGALPGSTQTLPLLIHRQLHVDLSLAVATSTLMLGVSALVLGLVATQGGSSRVRLGAEGPGGAGSGEMSGR